MPIDTGLITTMLPLLQGVAFFHAGSDIVRSKSLDRDSYNSGHPLFPILACNSTVACKGAAWLLGPTSPQAASWY